MKTFSQLHLYPDPTASALKNKLSELIHFPVNNIMQVMVLMPYCYSMFQCFLEGSDSMLTSLDLCFLPKCLRMNNVRCVEVPMILDVVLMDGILELP